MRTMHFLPLGLVLIATPAAGQPIDFTTYHTPAQVETEINRFPTRFPTLARVVTIGHSVEGRPIRAIKISDNPDVEEPAEGDVLFVALHHAREWLSTEFALSLAEQILTRYSTDPQVKADVDNLQIWIVPVVNPDGYVYTAAAASQRYWRKNRRNNADATFGVDLNRNWGYEWGLNSGSSSDTWSDIYRGTAPFSEPEVQALRAFIDARPNLKAFVTYHTYGELFLRPWSYTTADPPGESTLLSLYERSRDAISGVHGHVYAPTIGYTSSGEATDYLWGERRIAAFTPELRPSFAAAAGLSGFSPPDATIIPTLQENLPAALALIHDAAARRVWIRDHPADTGAEPSAVWTGSGWSQPFWISPDIWTDPAELTEGTTVTLHVRVHNNTGAPINGVRVDSYWTDPRISLEFPGTATHLIGTQTVTVPPGGRVLMMPWTVPTGTNAWGERHWCVGVVLKHAQDMPLTTQAQRSSNIAIRNFGTIAATTAFTRSVAATNFLDTDAELRVVIGSLPPGWTVRVPDLRQLQVDDALRLPRGLERPRDPEAITRKGRLLGATGLLLRPGETVLVPVTVVPPPRAPAGTRAEIHVQGLLLPLVPGKREPQGNGYTFAVEVRDGQVR
jgi:hypothetical protein